MPITREFRKTVWERAQADARFRAAMLTEAINELLVGDLDAGKAMLRDYVNATIIFDGSAAETGKPSKSFAVQGRTNAAGAGRAGAAAVQGRTNAAKGRTP